MVKSSVQKAYVEHWKQSHRPMFIE